MKHIKRFFTAVILILATAVIINHQTRFFKDIGVNIPIIAEKYPTLAENISKLSDTVNETISHIPSPREILAKIRNTDVPVAPDDAASNIYYASDEMLTFYADRTVAVSVSDDRLTVSGVSQKSEDKYLVYRFLDAEGNVLDQITDSANSQGQFAKQMNIPDGSHQFAVFTGEARYGNYNGYIYNYVYLARNENDVWHIPDSPVYDDNVVLYEKTKSVSRALRNTYDICGNAKSIATLAQSVTSGYDSDYDKALALHDWVALNISYDSDSIDGLSNNAPYVASDVLSTGRAVCLGYANLYAALCRSIDIPCNVVTGYALGVGDGDSSWNTENLGTTDGNHAWNEVYVDNRWIVVDTTWDTKNKIEDGVKNVDSNISHLYFDANLKFFSVNHRIIKYK